MRITAEWSEIPVVRRHAYFCLTILLCILVGNLVRHNSSSADETIVSARVSASKTDHLRSLEDISAQLEGQPVFDKNMSLAKPQQGEQHR